MPSPLDEEIRRFLEDQGDRYKAVVQKLKDFLEEYARTPEGRRSIYRVTSRGDYQDGQELKTAERIASKIAKKQREGQSGYSIHDLHDIVGVRVICIYPSDIEQIIPHIESSPAIQVVHREDIRRTGPREDGYRAVHLDIRLDDPILRDLHSELQIVTMLQETWAFKAHDPIYVRRHLLEATHIKQARLLSDVLEAVDQQSELLKTQISKEADAERARIDALKASYIKGVAFADIPDGLAALPKDYLGLDRTDKRRSMDVLRLFISRNSEELSTKSVGKLLAFADEYQRQFGIDRDLCRLLVLLSLIWRLQFVRDFALSRIDRVGGNLSTFDKLGFRAMSYYMLGHIERAIDETRRAISDAESRGNEGQLTEARNSLAYYLAETGDSRYKDEALRLAEQSVSECAAQGGQGEVLMRMKDTRGYVKIIFGATADEILTGYAECKDAYEANPDKVRAKSFFEIAQSKAFARLGALA